MTLKQLMLLSLVAVTACGGDKKKEADDPTAAAKAVSPMEYRKRQQAFADSVLGTAMPANAVAQKLGKGYAVGSFRLRDTLAFLAGKSACFKPAREIDPYLAGTVSFSVHISVIGSDVTSVQESKWTSSAGNVVDACLNQQSAKWKFDASFGKPAAYIVQVQFKQEPVPLK